MKRKILSILLSITLIISLTACGNTTNTGNNTTPDDNTTSGEKIKGNCTAIECIKKIEPENTVEEINKIIGFEGEKTDEQYNIYYWQISENTGVKVAYYSSTKGDISIDYDRDSLANNKVDFSRYSELQSKVKEGITYDEFISYIGNVQGTVIEKSSINTRYTWVSKDGSYLNASFIKRTGKCSFVSGRIK